MLRLILTGHLLTLAVLCIGCQSAGRSSASEPLVTVSFESEQAYPQGMSFTPNESLHLSAQHSFESEQGLAVNAPGHGYNRQFVSVDLASYPDLHQRMFGRLMVRLADDGKAGDFTMVQAEGPAAPSSAAPADTNVMMRVRVDGRHDHLMGNYDTWHDGGDGRTDWLTDCWNQPDNLELPPSEYRLQHGEWQCVQWHFDAANHIAEYWLNGKPLAQINSYGSGDGCLDNNSQGGEWTGPRVFATVLFGVEQYLSSASARHIAVDDVAVSDAPIACPP